LALLTACDSSKPAGASSARTGAAAEREEAIVVAMPADAQKLDPPQSTDSNSLMILAHLYDRLIEMHETETRPVPGLAKSWDVSADGLRYTFHLRDDATFSNGKPLVSSDVKATFDRIVNPDDPLAFGIAWSSEILGDWFDHIETPDDHTAVFVLNRPFVPLLLNLAMPAASIINPEHLRKVGANGSVTQPMGSGPYVLEEWKVGAYVKLKARENHWRGKPRNKTLFFRVQKDMNQAMAGLVRGDTHLVPVLSPAVIGDRSKLEKCEILEMAMPSLCYAIFNHDKDVCKPRELRLALNLAIDRKSICEGLLEGTSVPAPTVIPPLMIGHSDKSPHAFTYDPERARKLIADAGLKGTKIKMHCFNEPRPYNTVGTRLAQRLQEDFRKVGVEVELVQMDFGGFLETIDQRTVHEMALTGWMADTGDPDNFIYYMFGSPTNRSNYKNPEATRIMEEAQGEGDPAKREALYQAAQDIVLQDPPAVVISHAKHIKGVSKRLRGFKPHPIAIDYLTGAYLE